MSARNPEQALISAILRSGDVSTVIRHGVTAEMFTRYPKEMAYIERHFARHRRSPEKVAFKAQFPDFRVLATDEVEDYLDPLISEYARSSLLVLNEEVLEHLDDPENDPVDVLSTIEKRVRNIATVATAEPTVDILSDWSNAYEDVVGRADRRQAKGSTGMPTGIATLDRHTGGIEPGELVIVGARMGSGKTWFLTQVATAALRNGHSVLVESLEQPRVQMAQRLYTFLSKGTIKHSELTAGTVDLEEYREFLDSLSGHHEGSLYVTDASRGRTSVATIASHIERHRPELVCVDYLGLIKTEGKNRDWRDLAEMSADLKSLAAQYGVGIIAASQLNREYGMRSVAGAEAISGSDAFGADADVIVTLRRNRNTSQVLDAWLAKNRHGGDNLAFHLLFDPDNGVLREISPERVDEIASAEDDE